MHPRWRRCSSLKYSRYSRSSRLAGEAPRPSRCDARLSPRPVKIVRMVLTRADARRWVQDFEAARRADIDAKRHEGPRPQWSIALALSLLRSARIAAKGRPLIDARRVDQDERVRATWDRLRSHFIS